MDGIAAISSRITQIQGTIESLRVFATPSGAAVSATSGAGSFSSVLAAEIATTVRSTSEAGGLTADGVPADLVAYGNGSIPASALDEIGATGHRLWAPASAAYERLGAAAARDDVAISITDSYRTYASQVDLAARKGLYSQGGLAAAPGTSDHGWGRSVDLRLDAPALAWMRDNAATYGFAEDVPRESWHWTYSPRP